MTKAISYTIREEVAQIYHTYYTEKDFNEAVEHWSIEGIDFDTLCDLMNGDIDDFELTFISQHNGDRVTLSALDFFQEEIRERAYDNWVDTDYLDHEVEVTIKED